MHMVLVSSFPMWGLQVFHLCLLLRPWQPLELVKTTLSTLTAQHLEAVDSELLHILLIINVILHLLHT